MTDDTMPAINIPTPSFPADHVQDQTNALMGHYASHAAAQVQDANREYVRTHLLPTVAPSDYARAYYERPGLLARIEALRKALEEIAQADHGEPGPWLAKHADAAIAADEAVVSQFEIRSP